MIALIFKVCPSNLTTGLVWQNISLDGYGHYKVSTDPALRCGGRTYVDDLFMERNGSLNDRRRRRPKTTQMDGEHRQE